MKKTMFVILIVCGLVASFFVGTTMSQAPVVEAIAKGNPVSRSLFGDQSKIDVLVSDGGCCRNQEAGCCDSHDTTTQPASKHQENPTSAQSVDPPIGKVTQEGVFDAPLPAGVPETYSAEPENTGFGAATDTFDEQSESDILRQQVLALTQKRLKTMTDEELRAEVARLRKQYHEEIANEELKKANEILARIVKEYPKSKAAKKAKSMMSIPISADRSAEDDFAPFGN